MRHKIYTNQSICWGTIDIYAKSQDEAKSTDHVENPDVLYRFGRPLWGLPCGGEELVSLAMSKILGGRNQVSRIGPKCGRKASLIWNV